MKATALFLLLGLAASAFGQAAPSAGATRLAYPAGSTRIHVRGNVAPGRPDRYVIYLSAGEHLILHIDSYAMVTAVEVVAASTGSQIAGSGQGTADFRTIIPLSGNYLVLVSAIANQEARNLGSTAYDLTVEVPAAVRFSSGQTAAVRTGPTPGGLPVDYLLGLTAGQTLLLDLSTAGQGGVAVDVSDLAGQDAVYKSEPSNHPQAALRIPTTGEYIITVAPEDGAHFTYRLDMIEPAIRLPAKPIYIGFPSPGHIVMVSQAEGSAGTDQETVYSSIDNGTTWPTTVIEGKLAGAAFADGEHGYLTVAASRQGDGSLGPCLYATRDGGATWGPVEVPLPQEIDRTTVAGLTPSAPSFLYSPWGSIAVQVAFLSGSSQQFHYVTSDLGATWTITMGDPAPVVPEVMESQNELEDLLAGNQVQGGPDASRIFQGKPVGQWISQVQAELSVLVLPSNALISPDGQRLAMELAGCHTSRVPFTVFAVIDARGRVSYLHDQAGKPVYFDRSFGGNYFALDRLFGWLADSQTILLYAPPYLNGGGGSVARTSWASFGIDGQPKADFWTANSFVPAKGNRMLFSVGPGGYGHRAQNEIHGVDTVTGNDTTLYTGAQEDSLEISGISEKPDGAIEVRFRVVDGKEQKLTVPR